MAGKAVAQAAFNVRMEPALKEVIRRHAFERGVAINQLVTDVLKLWVHAATDPSDPFFSPRTMGVSVPDLPDERYPGYRESLVFLIPEKETV